MALESEGFHCGDDEAQWWMFGADTLNALKTYQVRVVCAPVPEWTEACLFKPGAPPDMALMGEGHKGGATRIGRHTLMHT